ncbi:MAG TPA: MMPL family transporter [Isosphaeraceae bacterium]
MTLDTLRGVVTRRPFHVACAWLVAAVVVGVAAPDLTRLTAESEALLLDKSAESARAEAIIKQVWPDQSYESMAVVALYRPPGLTPADHDYAAKLADAFSTPDRPREIARVLGPKSDPRVAERLISPDRTTQLVVAELTTAFVSPTAAEIVAWLQKKAAALPPPAGLELKWTGDAVIGRDYMADVQTSLDRAALATVCLLLFVLMAVYRSFWLSLVPLVTIGISLIISRGVLAWLVKAGFATSPLVELFLVAILFGSGTDFCLFISWRYAENWNPANPAGAMRTTLRRSMGALLTSAGTVIIGFLLMGTTKFSLFSSTGPSVAVGLALTVVATLTLTPSLLVILDRYRPRAFKGMTRASSGFWDMVGQKVMSSPAWYWAATMIVMVPIAILGTQTEFIQDTLAEMPPDTESVKNLRFVVSKMGSGLTSPLAIVLESSKDLRTSEGLALVDDVSRLLSRQRRLDEVRSATQPLGSTAPLDRARLSSRLGEVNQGFDRIAEGANHLRQGLTEGVAKLQAALWLERKTGLAITPTPGVSKEKEKEAAREALSTGLTSAASAIFGSARPGLLPALESLPVASTKPAEPKKPKPAEPAAKEGAKPADPNETMVAQLHEAAEGAGLIADGVRRAGKEIGTILQDPVGRRALSQLLINEETVREHPELKESFAHYMSPDGHRARIDVAQSDRVFSPEALEEVATIRRRLRDYLGEEEDLKVEALITGVNAGAEDTRTLTHADQVQTWFVVPIGVFIVLIFALRDPLACFNLVATMILTYLFALGVTHLVFVTYLGAEGLDWKVPYFLFVLLVAVGVDYNVFLMARLREETGVLGLRAGISRAIGQTGGLISSAAAITAVSFASFMFSPLSSLRQLGFALVVGIAIDAVLVRPVLVPCGHWLINRRRESKRLTALLSPAIQPLSRVSD